jgi:hypothetical protein
MNETDEEPETLRNPKSYVSELKGGIANLVINLLNAEKKSGKTPEQAIDDVVSWLQSTIIEPMKK